MPARVGAGSLYNDLVVTSEQTRVQPNSKINVMLWPFIKSRVANSRSNPGRSNILVFGRDENFDSVTIGP